MKGMTIWSSQLEQGGSSSLGVAVNPVMAVLIRQGASNPHVRGRRADSQGRVVRGFWVSGGPGRAMRVSESA